MSIKTQRISNLLIKEISDILQNEVHDEDIKFVTITACKVDTDLSLAQVYCTVLDDKKKDKFLLGIETDQTVYQSSPSVLERDVYRNQFLKSRGWKIFRVWSRDWWHNASSVTSSIVKEIEKQRKILEKS